MDKRYRIIVAGGRDFDDYRLLRLSIQDYIRNYLEVGISDTMEFVSGRAKGADRLGEVFADAHFIPVKCFEANWQKYGKVAGPMRNLEMAKYASEEGYTGVLIAFWDGESRGTKNMIDTAEKYGLYMKVVRYEKK